MGHQRRVIAVDGAWGVEQNRQQVFFDVPYFRGVFADTVKDKGDFKKAQKKMILMMILMAVFIAAVGVAAYWYKYLR